MKLVVWKNHLVGQVLYRRPEHVKKTAPLLYPNMWEHLRPAAGALNLTQLVDGSCPRGKKFQIFQKFFWKHNEKKMIKTEKVQRKNTFGYQYMSIKMGANGKKKNNKITWTKRNHNYFLFVFLIRGCVVLKVEHKLIYGKIYIWNIWLDFFYFFLSLFAMKLGLATIYIYIVRKNSYKEWN